MVVHARISAAILACLIGLGTVTVPARAEPVATSAISHEPLYAGLVTRAEALKVQTDGFAPSLRLLSQPDFQAYTRDIRALSDGDLAGHIDLKTRGTDSDLKCILKGVSLDLNIKMDALLAAKSDAEVETGLVNMSNLLSDNIDVIVTPATAESGLDCIIEFGKS